MSTQNEQGQGSEQRNQVYYTDRSSMRGAGIQKALLQYGRSNCYQLPLQSEEKEALPEGRVRVSNLALGLSPYPGRLFLLVDYGESLY